MKAIGNIRHFAAISALAISASIPVSAFAAADARYIDSYNEGSEPPSVKEIEQTQPQAVQVPQATNATNANVSEWGPDSPFALWDKDVTKASANPALAIPSRSSKQTTTSVGDE